MIPLKTDKEGNILPIKEKGARTPPMDDLLFFFKCCFAPGEEKYRMIFLVQLGSGCRIKEACYLQLSDVVENTNFRKWKVNIQKKKCNEIIVKELPEAIACLLRNWIRNNRHYILANKGFIFPNKSNNRTYHTKPSNVQIWLCKKRKQLIKLYPERSFGKIEGKTTYKNISTCQTRFGKTKKVESRHMWRSHLFKRLSGTFLYLLKKDPILVKEHLNHAKLATTEQYYIDPLNEVLQNTHTQAINEVFDMNFLDSIRTEDESDVVAVWDELKKFE